MQPGQGGAGCGRAGPPATLGSWPHARSRSPWALLALAACACVAEAPRPPPPAPGLERVALVAVVDGDTIRVRRADGTQERVRYIGIDTPESVTPERPVEPWGKDASEANAALLAKGTVYLERDISDRDRFGRLLRYVWVHTRTRRSPPDQRRTARAGSGGGHHVPARRETPRHTPGRGSGGAGGGARALERRGAAIGAAVLSARVRCAPSLGAAVGRYQSDWITGAPCNVVTVHLPAHAAKAPKSFQVSAACRQ